MEVYVKPVMEVKELNKTDVIVTSQDCLDKPAPSCCDARCDTFG